MCRRLGGVSFVERKKKGFMLQSIKLPLLIQPTFTIGNDLGMQLDLHTLYFAQQLI